MFKKPHLFGFPFVLMCMVFFVLSCGQPKSDPNTIIIWHWMTDRQDAFEELALQYENQTGIKVQFDLYAPSDAYSQKIIASAQSRQLPDIFGILDKKEVFAEFIKNGFVANLTFAFEANNGLWTKAIFPKALNGDRFEVGNIYGVIPGIYGVPLDVTNHQMLYNRKFLERAGIRKPPRTFNEFLEDAAILRRIGIPVFVSGWGERWMIECFASNYAFNIMGEDKVMDTFQGKVSYTDPDWIKVLEVFESLRDAGVFVPGIVTKSNKDAEKDFAWERAAFTFNGSWAVNVYQDINPDLDYGVMLPPVLNKRRPMNIWGGAGSSFVVNESSLKKRKAVDFLKWLSGFDAQVYLAQTTHNLPSNRLALRNIPDNLAQFAVVMDQTTHPNIWKYNEDPVVNEAFVKGIQSIIIGERTAKEVAEQVQSVKIRELKRDANRK